MFSFRAMGTEVAVAAPGVESGEEETLARAVAALFEAQEQRFSRFRDDSELSLVHGGVDAVHVSPELLAALLRARGYVELTDGIFDPAIGGALAAHGYDRPFAPGALDRAAGPGSSLAAHFADVQIDAARGTVWLPLAVRLDFGGMIKGYTCDRAAALLPTPSFVDAGGDAVMRGAGPDGDGWLVEVEDPRDAERVLVSLRVRDRAVATSAPNRRRWQVGGASAHHLIDPRTQRPARSDVAQVTVFAESAELAEVVAKTALVLGGREARDVLERTRSSGVLVRSGGRFEVVGDLEVIGA